MPDIVNSETLIKLILPGMLAIIIYLLQRLVNRIDKMLDKHEETLEDHEVRISILEKE